MLLRSVLLPLLPLIVSGSPASSFLLQQIQEQFNNLSRDAEHRLEYYRTENTSLRIQVIHQILNALGNLTVEVRDLTTHYWTQIEAHHLATEECLNLVRPMFDHYVGYAEQYIQIMAEDLTRYMVDDGTERFYPVAAKVQRGSTLAVHRPLHVLEQNPHLDNLGDVVSSLESELQYAQELWKEFQGLLAREIDAADDLKNSVQYSIETWYDFTVKLHHFFMEMQLERIDYYCQVETETVKRAFG